MIAIRRSLPIASALALGIVGFSAAPVHAQGFGVNVYGPGVSLGVQAGGYGYGPSPYYGAYVPAVPAPVVVAPARVVVPGPYPVVTPVVVTRRAYAPLPYYGYGYGRRGHPGRYYRY